MNLYDTKESKEISPMYIISVCSDMYFSIYGGNIASPNIFRANDSDKAPINSIAVPAAFVLLFIAFFIFNIVSSPGPMNFKKLVFLFFQKDHNYQPSYRCLK